MKRTLILLSTIAVVSCNNSNQAVSEETASGMATSNSTTTTNASVQQMKSFYDLGSETLEGSDFQFSALKGKRLLIVNTASECGYTPQYEQLQDLHEKFGGDNFAVIGFPSNDFGKQEPGSNEDIKAFCQKNYGVSFSMMAKTPVTGDEKHPVYAWLTDKELNGVDNAEVNWNFNKFLVDENGKWVAYFPSGVSPLDEQIIEFAEGK